MGSVRLFGTGLRGVAAVGVLLFACSSGADDEAPSAGGTARGSEVDRSRGLVLDHGEAADLIGVDADVVLTRQRDLVERGLVNVRTTNDTGDPLDLVARQLVSDAFDGPGPTARTSHISPGRTVNLQVPFGDVVDCESTDPVSGAMRIWYLRGPDDVLVVSDVPIDDASVLDDIRSASCTAREVAMTADVELRPALTRESPDLGTGMLAVDLVMRGRDGSDLVVESVRGTVLIGIDPVDSSDFPVALESGADVTVPLVVTVNRCDPHAIAEVTRRYAIDLLVSLDEGERVLVPLDVSALRGDMEALVAECQANVDG